MAPYRNVRYWLGDFRRRRALNSKEKFNHSHVQLRNVIEHAYGVLKARFLILKKMTPFSLTTQRNITIAGFALHNFIRKESLDDELFSTYDPSNVQLDNENVLVEEDGDEELRCTSSSAYMVLDAPLLLQTWFADEEVMHILVIDFKYLKIQGLLDPTCDTVADMIKGKTPEEILSIFRRE
ncbi:putative harbinger transposase-derived nuclease domain-containing protein [Tanacetum coccineum]